MMDNTEMEEKRVETEIMRDLSPDRMEQVNGGAAHNRMLVVACGGCGKLFTITSDTTEHICPCGYRNTYGG